MKPEPTLGRTELAIGAAGAALAAAGALVEGDAPVAVVAMGVMGGSLGAARTYPRAAWMVAAIAIAIAVLSERTLPDSAVLLTPVIAFCAGRWERSWGGVIALAALIAAGLLGAFFSEDSSAPSVLLPGAAWGAGRALRQREQVAAELAARVRELEEEREAHAALSVRYERARIASELHDIVAHAISVMVVQASAGQRLAAHDPESTTETFHAIAGAAREAEEDMGRLVALLADRDAVGPAPDLALVEELVTRAAGSGLDVRLRLEGEREGLPAAVAHLAYRVVQEGLTNALRYASGAGVTVVVRGERDALVVEVENAPAATEVSLVGAGTGNGLRGLRERASACGGSLDAGPTAAGGWRLSVRLPTRAAALS